MNNKSNFRRGSVELLILHLLSQQDYYGYEISTLIREQTDGYLNIPVGSLYPALYKLIDAGYISDYKKQVGRRQVNVYYHLEDSGRTHLQQLLEDYLRDCQCDPTGIEIYGYTGGRRGRQ